MDLIKKHSIPHVTCIFTGCTIKIQMMEAATRINSLHPQLFSHQWAEPLPHNCSDEPLSETNPSNPENGKIPAGGKRNRR